MLPVAVLLWLATRRPGRRTTGIQGGPSLESLLAAPSSRLCGIRLTQVIELDDDIIVGYHRGVEGRTASHCPAHEPLEPDPRDGQLVLHGIVRDSRSMQLLQQWHADQTPLTTAVSADRRFVAITDRRSRWAVVAEHS